jgi:alpha-L-rhamnosidase
MWERWDSWHHRHGLATASMNSFNHYAYGCVGDWLFRHVAGIGDDPRGVDGGFAKLLLRPGPGRWSLTAPPRSAAALLPAWDEL